MQNKYFTLEEANQLLPAVIRDLEALQDVKNQFEQKAAALRKIKTTGNSFTGGQDPFFTLECELEFLQIEADTYIQSIRRKGAELKDIEMGLIDFPALINGEEVLLCWKQGEESITHYHGLHDGFAGRKKIEE